MKKVKIGERFRNAVNAFLAEGNFPNGQIAFRERRFDLRNRKFDGSQSDSFSFWAFTKCLLFYLPGVTLLYSVTLFLCDYLIIRDNSAEHFILSFFWLGGGTFLTMFGMSKLGNLKYLQVVATVLAASFAVGLAQYCLPREIRREFFGYLIYFLPVIAFIGYLVKRRIDRETETAFL